MAARATANWHLTRDRFGRLQAHVVSSRHVAGEDDRLVPKTFYKRGRFGNRPPCVICMGPGQGDRSELHLPHGVSVGGQSPWPGAEGAKTMAVQHDLDWDRFITMFIDRVGM